MGAIECGASSSAGVGTLPKRYLDSVEWVAIDIGSKTKKTADIAIYHQNGEVTARRYRYSTGDIYKIN